LTRTLSVNDLERVIARLLMTYGAKRNPHDPGLAIKHIAEAAINTYAELFERAAAEPSLGASGRIGDKRWGIRHLRSTFYEEGQDA
jgi:hypothetical protein